MDHCGAFVRGFLGTQGFDMLLKGNLCVENQIFAGTYRHVYAIPVSQTFTLLGCLLFVLASLGRAGREGIREERERDGESKRHSIFSAD